MLRNKSIYLLLILLIGASGTNTGLAAPATDALVSPALAAVGTAFTYQGRLTDGGSNASGTYDFEFKLYDASTGGSQVGSTVTQGDITVTAGLFTVSLDFGSSAFTGSARWLEVGVRAGSSTGAYTALSPRQELTPTPYALYASNSANSAAAPWSGLTGVPSGFADGADAGLYNAYVLVQDQKSSGTEGGGCTAGTWKTRDLNTEVADTASIASLASNQITLSAGTYRVRANAPGFHVDRHKARLQDGKRSVGIPLTESITMCGDSQPTETGLCSSHE